MKFKIYHLSIITLPISLVLIFFSFTFFSEIPELLSTIIFVAVSIVILPIVIWKYSEYLKKKQIEENFPAFLRDFVESVRGGLTVPEALKSVSKNDYKALSPYVKKLSSQLEWGIPLDKALMNFVKSTKSKIIGRVISSVIETHRFGGKLAETFEALSEAALEIERLRLERKMYLQSQMITGYIIFFVFLGVIIGLEKFLVPSLTETTTTNLPVSKEVFVTEFKTLFRNLVYIQAFFAGLIVGKMSEGAMAAGIKHSLIMIAISFIVFLFIS
ncbi:MAG: type II secretion system F family protein [Candidatus Aenigmarchaeota archaeon]|nr:type II secretion system F family protein [Candidatus Aenigmarchaeota archaeon]